MDDGTRHRSRDPLGAVSCVAARTRLPHPVRRARRRARRRLLRRSEARHEPLGRPRRDHTSLAAVGHRARCVAGLRPPPDAGRVVGSSIHRWSASITLPSARIAARSRAFASSRTLPRQLAASRRFSAAGESVSTAPASVVGLPQQSSATMANLNGSPTTASEGQIAFQVAAGPGKRTNAGCSGSVSAPSSRLHEAGGVSQRRLAGRPTLAGLRVAVASSTAS